MCTWCASLRNLLLDYLHHVKCNYTWLNYLSDLFKLFIILNYIYFSYMIFAKLWLLLNKCFCQENQERDQCRKRSCPRRSECQEDKRQKRAPRATRCPEETPPICTCYKSHGGGQQERPEPKITCRRSSSEVNIGQTRNCAMFAKPARNTISPERRESSNKITPCPMLPCNSSVDRIQVEFNCKPKKTRKTREQRAPKSKSCTKCGKNLAQISSSKCQTRVPLPISPCGGGRRNACR